MRLVVIDTETTGLSPRSGDRMVEIGAVVIEQGEIQPEQSFHRYLDPERHIPAHVVAIHGIDAQKLNDEDAKPFSACASAFLELIQGSTMVFHNAPFDLRFISHELALLGLTEMNDIPVIDTLKLARQKFPNQPNNLDALCDRLAIDHSHRQLHGALIDATLTARAYLAMLQHDLQSKAITCQF